jgi:hypothetical protein
MARASLIVAAVVIIVIIIVAFVYFGTNYFGNNPSATPTPTPTSTATPSATTVETVRDSVLYFISTNHTETNPYIIDHMTWSGGRQETGLVGSETYSYTGGDWNVTIQYPVVPNPVYTVNATYTSPTTHLVISWQGTYENGTVTENTFSYTP